MGFRDCTEHGRQWPRKAHGLEVREHLHSEILVELLQCVYQPQCQVLSVLPLYASVPAWLTARLKVLDNPTPFAPKQCIEGTGLRCPRKACEGVIFASSQGWIGVLGVLTCGFGELRTVIIVVLRFTQMVYWQGWAFIPLRLNRRAFGGIGGWKRVDGRFYGRRVGLGKPYGL